MSDLETASHSILHMSRDELINLIVDVRRDRRNAIINTAVKKAAKKKQPRKKAPSKLIEELSADQIRLMLAQTKEDS